MTCFGLVRAGGSAARPSFARIDPGSGELYVVDEYPGGFPGRVLVYKPPFKSGQSADREFKVKKKLEGDYKNG